MLVTYKKLQKEFNKKVKALQEECEHKSSQVYESMWAPGHFSGYKVRICTRCNKEIAQIPSLKEREKAQEEWMKKSWGEKEFNAFMNTKKKLKEIKKKK